MITILVLHTHIIIIITMNVDMNSSTHHSNTINYRDDNTINTNTGRSSVLGCCGRSSAQVANDNTDNDNNNNDNPSDNNNQS